MGVGDISAMALQDAPLGAHARVGSEEHLDLGIREHDGSDITSLGYHVVILGDGALRFEHGGANARIRRDLRYVRIHERGANLATHIPVVDRDAAAGLPWREANGDGACQGIDRSFVVKVDAAVERGEGDGAVHGTRVELFKTKAA